MNQPLFLNIVEKLETFLGKLPSSIQKPVLHELTPLKELFLQQRPPRIAFVGTSKLPLSQILSALFGFPAQERPPDLLTEIFRWQQAKTAGAGPWLILDAREADDRGFARVSEELKETPADIFIFVDDGDHARAPRKREAENLTALLACNDKAHAGAKIVAISLFHPPEPGVGKASKSPFGLRAKLHDALEFHLIVQQRLVQILERPVVPTVSDEDVREIISLFAQNLPNPARVEMIRISRDRHAQSEVAQVLVKSTTAICTAIGAQPIPLADLPILTTLQLVMVSGIIYLSGRERSLRVATEFVAALGANVGAGMLLREGTRVVLKFFPGWGNVVCGMVAGAGTYAIGRATIVYFIEGLSLREARRTYLSGRRRSRPPALARGRRGETGAAK
jgi:uncharacterized protein (DUF697 family)